MTDPVLNMLGLCARARKLITGEKAVAQAIRSGGCCVAVLDSGAAKNGEKAVTQACETCGVPLVRTPAFTLGDAIGKPGRMAAAITDEKMARRILELSEQPGG